MNGETRRRDKVPIAFDPIRGPTLRDSETPSVPPWGMG